MSYNNATPTVGWNTNFPKITGSSSNINLTGSSTSTTLNVIGSTTTVPSGSVLVANGSSGLSWGSAINNTIELNSDLGDFCELVLMALGYDITFEDFKNMSKEERKSIIRDIKINRVLKGE